MKKLFFIVSLLLMAAAAFAQSNTDKVRQFERLMREWKSAGYSTGSEKYTQLKSMVTEGCKMSEHVAKAYIDEYSASTFDIKANPWFQYIKEKKISISLRDLREKTDDDGRRIVYCWIKYTQPGRQDKEDFVGFKFDGGKIFYICNDDMERANRIKADSETNVVDTRPTAPFSITSCTVDNGSYPFDAANLRFLYPRIKCRCSQSGSYTINITIYNPDGKQRCSYECKNVSMTTGEKEYGLSGWGSSNPGGWQSGSYRIEFRYNGTCLYTYQFSIPVGQAQSVSSADNGKSAEFEPVSDNYFDDKYKTVCTINCNGMKISLLKKINLYDKRNNPDKYYFYRTGLAVDVDNNGKQSRYEFVLPDHDILYTNRSNDFWMLPCMAYDSDNKVAYVFTNSKDANVNNYGMEGYVYKLDLVNFKVVKETVFTKANYGWFAYFNGISGGKLELAHFSYAGYYAIRSLRSNGSWQNYNDGRIQPDSFKARNKSHGKTTIVRGR